MNNPMDSLQRARIMVERERQGNERMRVSCSSTFGTSATFFAETISSRDDAPAKSFAPRLLEGRGEEEVPARSELGER
jgi:hypothetical protein